MKKKIILISAIMLALSTLGVNAKQMATVFNPTTMHRKAVEVGDKHAFDGGYILEVAQASKIDEGLLGGSVVTNYSKSLSASINSTQSTIPVTSITTKDGHDLTMGDFGSRVFLVIEPGKNKEEIVMCTGISGLTWTGCTRGLAFYGTSTASIADNRKTHQAGSQIIISNTHYVYDENVDKDSDETIAGGKVFTGAIDFQDAVDFDNLPTSTTTAPTLDEQVATKKYVDDSMTAGAPDATESVKGISELATQAEMAAGTATGGTGASLVLKSQYATSTGGNPYVSVPVTGSDGKLDQGFIDLTEDWNFTNAYIPFYDSAIYGIGSDGASTTVGTSTLSRDMFFTNLTIATGTALVTNGYKVYVSGTLIVSGDIDFSGNNGGNAGNASGTTGGTAGAAGNGLNNGSLLGSSAGLIGGAGGNADTNGSGGSAGSNLFNVYNGNGVAGGNGAGNVNQGYATKTGGAGGSAGTGIIASSSLYSFGIAQNIFDYNGRITARAGSGSGGGGAGGNVCSGGSSGDKGAGGGGGGSASNGGVIFISAKHIILGVSGKIKANGGNGGNGGNGSNATGAGSQDGNGGGGGAGGNGGLIVMIYADLVNDGTISVSGGTGGTKGTAGSSAFCTGDTGTAQDGTAGSAGTIIYYNL